MNKLLAFCAAVIVSCAAHAGAAEAARAERVVVVVWDGMRPDFVSAEETPALWEMAREGVTFRNHHAVYPSSTEVNGTALATGVYPNRSGLMANLEYRPELDPLKPISTEEPTALRRGDELSGGKYIALPTIAERVLATGARTAVAGTKYGAILQDRSAHRESEAARNSVAFFGRGTLPESAMARLVELLGPFSPKPEFPNTRSDAWTTKALTDVMWKTDVPKFSLLWLSDPDFSQHNTAPGAPIALAALRSVDADLAVVRAALEAKKLRDTTDVFVVSDHGFSTVERAFDLPALLNAAGFSAAKEFQEPPKPGQIMVVGNGGTALFYVIGHDAEITHRLVEFLQGSEFAGVLFSREKFEGTFPLSAVRIDTPGAPDVAIAFRWSDAPNQFGARGMIDADWNRQPGKGTHATLSRFDMHNTLIAAGPDFQRGATDDLPTGNVDLAPTILSILGIKSKQPLDGRVLTEAMIGNAETPRAETRTLEATHAIGERHWHQYLRTAQVGSTIYFDEGNGGAAK